ncbi:MAG: helix-turn-helix transcriptional regulator [Myxococcales bacterium]|nr:helix-turn-helix transcriptional regulator [Myxococcales bacterium]
MPRVEVATLLRALDRLDAPLDEWLVGVARAIYAVRRGRDGVRLFAYEVERAAGAVRSRNIATGDDFEMDPAAYNDAMTPAGRVAVYRAGARVGFVGDFLLRLPGIAEMVRGELERRDLVEVFNVHAASDEGGVGIVIPARERGISPRSAELLGRCAEQLAIGVRFREALVRGVGPDAALMSPAGEVEAVGERLASTTPRDALRELVRAREASRGARGGAGDPEEGASWIGLLRGAWSCVDLFEADGRRHVVVARTAPALIDERALSEREVAVVERLTGGASAKETAIELDLSEAEVSRTLARALARLGVRDRAALVRLRALLGR